MKNILLKVLTGIILMAFIFFGYSAGAFAATTTKTLDNNTRITPPGTSSINWASIPEFKKGTVVTLNENGEVIEGTLSSAVFLQCVGEGKFYYRYYFDCVYPNRIIRFKEGCKVTFNDKGEVVKGTVAGALLSIPIDNRNYISLRDETEIIFHDNGIPAICTLDFDTYLRPIGWQKNLTAGYTDKINCPGFIEFKGGTQIQLNDIGEATKGTLNKDTKLISPTGSIKVYEAGTTVEFDDKGVVVKASK